MKQKETLIEPMDIKDINKIMFIEHQSYPNPWSIYLFLTEIKNNKHAEYLVLRQEGEIIAYGGMWVIFEEAHITNLAVDPVFRNKGNGDILLKALIQKARDRGTKFISLEVRVSNSYAIKLYKNNGFIVEEIKKYYYGNEDAYLMTVNLEQR